MKCYVYDLKIFKDLRKLESVGYSKRAAERFIEVKKKLEHQDTVRKMIDQDLEAQSHIY